MNPNTVSVFANLRIAGALILDKEETEFPVTAKQGTLLIKDKCLYAFITYNGMETWYPLVRSLSKTYVHTQAVPALAWVVNTNFGSSDFWYQVKNTNGDYEYPSSVDIIDSNSFRLNFSDPVAGTAIVVGTNDLDIGTVQASLIKIGANVVIDSSGMLINNKRVLTVDGGQVAWENVTSKPTTIAGFGLTDAASIGGSATQDFTSKDHVVAGDLTVNGAVIANGANFTVNSTTVTTADSIIQVNKGQVGAGVSAGFAGLTVDRGTLPDYQMVFNETIDMFQVGQVGNLETLASQNYVVGLINIEGAARIAADNAEIDARTAAITAATAGLGETTATIKSKLGITTLSGSNTGDETNATILSKLSIGSISGVNTGDQTNVAGNAGTATKLATARNINLTGDVTGTGSFDGSGDLNIATTLKGDTVSTKTFTGAISCNLASEGSYVVANVTGATTLSITGVPDSTKAYGMTFELTNAGTNVTWPASVTWLGTAPTLRASGISMVTLVTRNGGTTWLGSAA